MLEGLLAFWFVSTLSLVVMSKLPLGIQIDGWTTALVTAFVLSLLNAFLLPILEFVTFPITFLTFGLFNFVINAIVFQLAAVLVRGFNLRGGCLSALVGPIVLGLFNSLVFALLPI